MAKKNSIKPIIFISHITKEKSIADALAELIRVEFRDMVTVFVSSINLGREWFDSIKQALLTCELAIVLSSAASVKRPWINFESGAVWARNKMVIPLCHSGVTKDSLPSPLDVLQAINATDPTGLQELVEHIADCIGATANSTDFSNFVELVCTFERNCAVAEVESDTKAESPKYRSEPAAALGHVKEALKLANADILSVINNPAPTLPPKLNPLDSAMLHLILDDPHVIERGVVIGEIQRLITKVRPQLRNADVSQSLNKLRQLKFLEQNTIGGFGTFIRPTQKAWDYF